MKHNEKKGDTIGTTYDDTKTAYIEHVETMWTSIAEADEDSMCGA